MTSCDLEAHFILIGKSSQQYLFAEFYVSASSYFHHLFHLEFRRDVLLLRKPKVFLKRPKRSKAIFAPGVK